MNPNSGIAATKRLAELVAWFDHEPLCDYRRRIARAARLSKSITRRELGTARRRAEASMWSKTR
jgi:hypothetical protein